LGRTCGVDARLGIGERWTINAVSSILRREDDDTSRPSRP
jgi:hypothetical protein